MNHKKETWKFLNLVFVSFQYNSPSITNTRRPRVSKNYKILITYLLFIYHQQNFDILLLMLCFDICRSWQKIHVDIVYTRSRVPIVTYIERKKTAISIYIYVYDGLSSKGPNILHFLIAVLSVNRFSIYVTASYVDLKEKKKTLQLKPLLNCRFREIKIIRKQYDHNSLGIVKKPEVEPRQTSFRLHLRAAGGNIPKLRLCDTSRYLLLTHPFAVNVRCFFFSSEYLSNQSFSF